MNRFIKIGIGAIITVALLGNVTMPKAQAEDYDDSKILEGLREDSYRLKASDYVTPGATDSAYEGTIRFVTGTDHGQRKFILHLEGNHYEMGFQHGYLLAPFIEKTVDESVEEMVQFFFKGLPDAVKNYYTSVVSNILMQSAGMFADGIPERYQNEIWGIVNGVAKKKMKYSGKQKLFNKIVALNLGPDIALAAMNLAILNDPSLGYAIGANYIDKGDLAHMCDGFVVKGEAVAGRYQNDKEVRVIMGRNFMYTDKPWWKYGIIAEYYPHNVAVNGQAINEIKHVGVGMPGLIGIVAGMNAKGIGMGANLVSSTDSANLFVDIEKFGMGAGIATRMALAESAELQAAIDIIKDVQLGAPWLFTIADGQGDNKNAVTVGKAASCDPTVRSLKSDDDESPDFEFDITRVHPEKDNNLLVTSNFFMKQEMYNDFIVGVSGYFRYNELLSRVKKAIGKGGICFDSSDNGCAPKSEEYRHGTNLVNYLRDWDENPSLVANSWEEGYADNYPIRTIMATSVTLFDLTTTRMKTLYSKYDHDWVYYDLADN